MPHVPSGATIIQERVPAICPLFSARGLWMLVFVVGLSLSIWQTVVWSQSIRDGCSKYVCNIRPGSPADSKYFPPRCVLTVYEFTHVCYEAVGANLTANLCTKSSIPTCFYDDYGPSECPWFGNIPCFIHDDTTFSGSMTCPRSTDWGIGCYNSLSAFLISIFSFCMLISVCGFIYVSCKICPE
jgi:hypothetical protein